MLVLSREQLVSVIEFFGSLLQCHAFNMAFNPRIIVSHTNCTLSLHHLNGLSDCSFSSFSFYAELIVNRLSNPRCLQFCVRHLVLRVVDLNDVTCAIFEPKNQTSFTVLDCEVVFSDYVLHGLTAVTTAAVHAYVAFIATTLRTLLAREKIVANDEHLQ